MAYGRRKSYGRKSYGRKSYKRRGYKTKKYSKRRKGSTIMNYAADRGGIRL